MGPYLLLPTPPSSGGSSFILLYVFVFRSSFQTCICCFSPCFLLRLLPSSCSFDEPSSGSLLFAIRFRISARLVFQSVCLPTHILRPSTSSVRISNPSFSLTVCHPAWSLHHFCKSPNTERNKLISQPLVWGSLLLYLMFNGVIFRLRAFRVQDIEDSVRTWDRVSNEIKEIPLNLLLTRDRRFIICTLHQNIF